MMLISRMFPTRRSRITLAVMVMLGTITALVADRFGAGEWGRAFAGLAGAMVGALLDRETFYGVEPKVERRSDARRN